MAIPGYDTPTTIKGKFILLGFGIFYSGLIYLAVVYG